MRPGAGEIGRVAAADGVDVDAVDAVRKPGGLMRKLTPPAVCQARTLPIGWPRALTSGIGGPPCGSTVMHAGEQDGGEKDEFAHVETLRSSI